MTSQLRNRLSSDQIRARLEAVTQAPTERDPAEIELERKVALLKKARVIRNNLRNLRGTLEGMRPEKVYMWVNVREERQVWFQGLGYELCTDSQVKSKWKREDGTHRRGDLILYECARELHEALKLDSQVRAIEDMESSKETFVAFAERLNIPTYTPEERR